MPPIRRPADEIGQNRERWISTCHPRTTRLANGFATGSLPTRSRPARTSPRPDTSVPHWPAPYGLDADPIDQLVIDDELSRAHIRRPNNQIGIGWAAPTILLAGTPEQHERYLPKIFSGEEFWCQLFSETEAGSDLANLATRAERDGDEYVINGSKIWSSGAHHSKFGILIARTDPDQPKHKGISYFIMPMDAEGLSMSPIVDMTTAHSFNQVFFDNVRLPVANRIGEEGDGWRLAKVTLSNERVSLSSAGSMWGVGPSAELLIDLCREQGGIADPVLRQRAVDVHIEAELLRLNRFRSLSATLQGKTPGAEASIQKIMADDHGQHVLALAKDLAGANGMLDGSGPAGHVPSAMRGGPTENNFDRAVPRCRSDLALRLSVPPGVDPRWRARSRCNATSSPSTCSGCRGSRTSSAA